MTNRLSKVGDKFRSVFKLVDGTKFYGQLLGLPDTSRVSNFLSARRYLRTAVKTIVQPGNVMIADGTTFIIAEHGEGFYNEPIYRHFKLFDVDAFEPWYPVTTTQDTVTGVKKVSPAAISSTSVYLSTQPAPLKVDGLQIPAQHRICICNQNIGVGDRVGDHIVTKSDKMLGVFILEMKKI